MANKPSAKLAGKVALVTGASFIEVSSSVGGP